MANKEQKSSKSDTKDNKSLTRRGILGTAGAVAVSGLLSGVGSGDEHTSSEEFDPVEANSWEIRRGYETGAFTAVEVVEAYLDRILAYEDQLQAVITINPNAIQRAEELDEACLESDEIARFERPREYRFIDFEIPRTPSQKIDRQAAAEKIDTSE